MVQTVTAALVMVKERETDWLTVQLTYRQITLMEMM